MKHVYMSLSITTYNNGYTDCTLWECIDEGEMIGRKLTLTKAQQIQWELVKAGATRTFRPNWFDNTISQVDVNYWARH